MDEPDLLSFTLLSSESAGSSSTWANSNEESVESLKSDDGNCKLLRLFIIDAPGVFSILKVRR